MCEFLERAWLRGTPTEEVREWSIMTHRVVELTGPFPTPDDMRVELWLHEESATRLLDMCDRIDAEFDRTKAENAKLLAERDYLLMNSNPTATELRRVRSAWKKDRDENAKLRELARGLGQCAQGVGCEDCLLYDLSEPDHCREERLSRELGIEAGDDD